MKNMKPRRRTDRPMGLSHATKSLSLAYFSGTTKYDPVTVLSQSSVDHLSGYVN